MSRVAVGKIERGEVEPQARTLDALAKALEVPIGKLATSVRRLASVRFRAVKRLFRVSYKTVLYRLVASRRATSEVWSAFQHQHRLYFGSTLRKADEPVALQQSEFAWHWGRSGEPERLSRHDFVEDRLSRLVRRALQEEHISLGRSAEILGLSREQMRQRVREWVN